MNSSSTSRLACIVAIVSAIVVGAIFPRSAAAQPATAPSTAPASDLDAAKTGKLPFVHVDVAKKQVRIDCETIGCQNPLEFFCVVAGGSEHEAILRSRARPSHVHLALLMLGLEPGEPVHFVEAEKKWLPPQGPPLKISCQWTDADGKAADVPAFRMMRDLRTKKEMPELTWIFTGSHVMPDGVYGADVVGYLVSVVNFELSMIDVPELASNSNETLEWVANEKLVPPPGTKVTMTIERAAKVIAPPMSQPTTRPATLPVRDSDTGGF